MKLSDFDFELPEKLIAKYPAKNRDESRLMVIDRATGHIAHRKFKDILEYFDDKDCMVINNTKVFPARMYGRKEKTGAKIEVFLLRELNKEHRLWDVLVDPARKIRVGNKLYFGKDESLIAEVVDNTTSRGRTIRFIFDGTDEELKAVLDSYGETPIPKYINREVEDIDKERYQTIFAKHEGAVAAPTAGLHFTPELMKRLMINGVDFAELTLHIGLGTFRPIEVEDLTKHKMEAEYFSLPQETADMINKAKQNNRKVCAIGTTTMRALESSITTEGLLKPQEDWSNIFIHPPYDFHIADSLVTNFHLPKTSLLILLTAFMGYELTMDAYKRAIKEGYQFFTYGDAMLVL